MVITSLSTIDWDTAVFFGAYGFAENTNNSRLETIVKESALDTNDGHTLLIFMKGDKIVQFINEWKYPNSKLSCLEINRKDYPKIPNSTGVKILKKAAKIPLSKYCLKSD